MKSALNSGTAAPPVVGDQANDDDDDLKDIGFVCGFFGGRDTPLHQSTIYRKIKEGIIPGPEDLGGRMSRWRMSKLRAARQQLFDRSGTPEVA